LHRSISSPSFFATIGAPLVAGRGFDERDTQGAPLVAIVNESFAARFWPGEDAIGRRVIRGSLNKPGDINKLVDGKPRAKALEMIGN